MSKHAEPWPVEAGDLTKIGTIEIDEWIDGALEMRQSRWTCQKDRVFEDLSDPASIFVEAEDRVPLALALLGPPTPEMIERAAREYAAGFDETGDEDWLGYRDRAAEILRTALVGQGDGG